MLICSLRLWCLLGGISCSWFSSFPFVWCTNVDMRNSITADELWWAKIWNNYEWMKHICSPSGKIGCSSDKHRKNVSLNEGGKQESTPRGARKNYNPQGRWHAEGREINAKHMSSAGHSLSCSPSLSLFPPPILFFLGGDFTPTCLSKIIRFLPGGRGIAKGKKDFRTFAHSVYCT